MSDEEVFLMLLGTCTLGFIILAIIGGVWEFLMHLYNRFTGEYSKEKIRLKLKEEQKTASQTKQDVEMLIRLKKYAKVYDMDDFVKQQGMGMYSSVFGYFTTILERNARDIPYYQRSIDSALKLLAKADDETPEELIQAWSEHLEYSREELAKAEAVDYDTMQTFYDQFKTETPPFYGSADLKKFFESKLKITPEEEPEKESVIENSRPVGVLFGHRNRRF